MKLSAWLADNKKSAEQLGKELGCTGQAVRRWCSGDRMPDASMIEKIEIATGGAVTLQDLHDTRLAFLKASADPAPANSERAA